MKQKEEALFYQRSSGDASSAFIQQKVSPVTLKTHIVRFSCSLRSVEKSYTGVN